MNNATFLKLKELVEATDMLGYSLLLEDRINLISYDSKGKIKASHLYDYNEHDIENLEKRLRKIALRQRQKWEPEFMRLMPSIASLSWSIKFGNLGATLYNGEEEIGGTFIYNEDGLLDLTDTLTDALLDQHALKLEQATGNTPDVEEQSEQETKKCSQGNCKDCKDDQCKDNPNIAILIWGQLDEDQQRLVSAKLSPEEQKVLAQVLNLG